MLAKKVGDMLDVAQSRGCAVLVCRPSSFLPVWTGCASAAITAPSLGLELQVHMPGSPLVPGCYSIFY
jgi:hypothetical protein